MVKIQLYPQGTRVRVKRGAYPIDPTLVGREGMVVHLHRNVPVRYGVELDGEDSLRSMDESELEPITSPAGLEEAGAHRGGGGSDAPS